MKALNKSDLNELLELRKLKKAFYNKNAAILEVDILVNGEVKTFKYKSIAGNGSNKEGVLVTNIDKSALSKNLNMTENELLINYFAKDQNGVPKPRFYDSENKMLDAFDEELHLFKVTNNSKNIVVKQMRLKTLYEPCNSCKKQILIRKDFYKIPDISVEAVIISKGQYVKGNEQLTKLGIK